VPDAGRTLSIPSNLPGLRTPDVHPARTRAMAAPSPDKQLKLAEVLADMSSMASNPRFEMADIPTVGWGRVMHFVGVLCLAAASLAGPVAAANAGGTAAERVRELEGAGRAQPRQAAASLGDLLAQGSLDGATRLEALTVQGMLLSSVPDDEAAEGVARTLDGVAQPGASAAALLVRARLADKIGNTHRATALIDDAMAHLPADATALTRLRFVGTQAAIRGSADKLEDAIRLGHEALKLADAMDQPWRQAEIRNDLSMRYFVAKQVARAASLNAEAMAIAKRDGDAMTLAHTSNRQAIFRDAEDDLPGARRSFLAALDYARKAGSKTDEALYLANLADSYLKSAEYPTALRYAQQALPLTRELKNLDGETVALANIGLAQIAMRDIRAGKANIRDSIAIDERRDSISGMSSSYEEMGQYLERAGDLQGAVDSLHQFRALSDQMLQRDQQQAIFEMQEQFDAERRAKELELLQRENDLKGEQLRSRDLQQGLWWLLAASGLLTIVIVAMLMRRVRDTNRELASSNAKLQVQADIDPLTGLSNRRHFQAAMRQLAQDGKLEGTVFLLDIDHFKRINDCWGHAIGDAVLVEVARRLRAVLREPDLIVRWGGEEFLVVVQALGPDNVETMAARMLDVIGARSVEHEGRIVPVTVSIGYATFPIEPVRLPVSWERAINLVDTALYLAKAHGRNRAYGVSNLHAQDEAQFDAIGQSLESAWRTGVVSLTLLHGPGAAAPETRVEHRTMPLPLLA
jgi:diguanylate cyclase (GGDEF)-like protein